MQKQSIKTLCKKNVPIDEVIGGNLRYYREFYSITQNELATHLGLSFQQIQKYESGKSRIACSTLFLISNFLGVPIFSFFEGLDCRSDTKNDLFAIGHTEFSSLHVSFDEQSKKYIRDLLISMKTQ